MSAVANDVDHPIHDVLARWKAAFDGHKTTEMADLYTTDALFQGFGPQVTEGRDEVYAYYASVPDNRSADVTVVRTYRLGDEVAGGFADVLFRDTEGWQVPVHLSLVLRLTDGAWQIHQYHVSTISTEH